MSKLLQRCPLCESPKIRELYLAQDPHYGISGSHRLVRCLDCSLVFINPMYSDEELAQLYPADYYAYHDEIQTARWKNRMKRLLGYWQGTKDPKFKQPGVMLDIGCGVGTFIRVMRDKVWTVYGVEISQSATKLAQSRGLNVFGGSLAQANFPSDFFDYIRASHSFEHITRPHETLDEIHRLLKPSGELLLAVPNIKSLSARLFGPNWYHLCPPVHAFNYSTGTLSRILAIHNFQVTNMIFNSHYAGLLGSLQIWLNRKSCRNSFEGSFFNNRGLRVLCGWVENLTDFLGLGDMIEITAVKKSTRVMARAA